MELYIVFFMIVAVALIVLAIYITKVEHLAVTNRTRIARLELAKSISGDKSMLKGVLGQTEITRGLLEGSGAYQEPQGNEYTRYLKSLLALHQKSADKVCEKLATVKEENKSLSFQLAEVSKALQEKKLLIYEMDEKLSRLDAELGQANLRLESQKNTILAYQGRSYFGMDLGEPYGFTAVQIKVLYSLDW